MGRAPVTWNPGQVRHTTTKPDHYCCSSEMHNNVYYITIALKEETWDFAALQNHDFPLAAGPLSKYRWSL